MACSRPSLLRAIPTSFHMILPRRLWKKSTDFVPLTLMNLSVRSRQIISASSNSFVSVGIVPVRISVDKNSPTVYGATKYPSAKPCIKADAPSLFAPWSEKFASPNAKQPGIDVIKL